MKKFILFFAIPLFFACEAQDLTPKEQELVNAIGFDTELIIELKKATKNELKQLPTIDNETGDVLDGLYDGIHSAISEERANSIVKKLKERFKSKGYLIFVFNGKDDEKSIAVIKGSDELDILRYRRTDGINHDYENKDIVSKLAQWKESYGLIVIGCGRDWLEVEFKTMPNDLEKFANEVYEFCPDVVDQGVGSVENLKEVIEQMHGIWLWWD